LIVWHDTGGQRTPKWFKLREGRWTGSRVVRLLHGKSLPREYEWDGNNATKRGQLLETIAIREYEREYKTKVAKPDLVTNSIYPNASYSPDGIDGPWLLEIKSFAGQNHEDLVAEKVPLAVLAQIYFGMIITGKRKARLLAFNPEYVEQLTVIEIKYDKLVGANIRKRLRADMRERAKT